MTITHLKRGKSDAERSRDDSEVRAKVDGILESIVS